MKKICLLCTCYIWPFHGFIYEPNAFGEKIYLLTRHRINLIRVCIHAIISYFFWYLCLLQQFWKNICIASEISSWETLPLYEFFFLRNKKRNPWHLKIIQKRRRKSNENIADKRFLKYKLIYTNIIVILCIEINIFGSKY